jgi:hypothetical protein
MTHYTSGFRHQKYNSICNICFLAAQDNEAWGSQSPARFLRELSRKQHFARTMKSHLIPYEGAASLWMRGVRRAFPKFLNERQRLICRAFEEEAGTKLFKAGR